MVRKALSLSRSLRIALIAAALGLVLIVTAIGWVLPSWLYARDFHAVRGDLARVTWARGGVSSADIGRVRPKNEQLIADLTKLVFVWSYTLAMGRMRETVGRE